MSMVDRLMEQLQIRGLKVLPGDVPGQLKLAGPDKEKTAEVLAALKNFKPQLLERYGLKTETMPGRESETASEPDPEPDICPICNREILSIEDRQRLVGMNPFCSLKGCPYRNGSLSMTGHTSS